MLAVAGGAGFLWKLAPDGPPRARQAWQVNCVLWTRLAPALVVFNDAGALRALGGSLRAAIANWRPIGVYCLAVFVLGVVLPIFSISIAHLFGDAVAGLVALFVVVPYLFTFVAALHISDYVSYRDVFHADEPPPGTSSDSPS